MNERKALLRAVCANPDDDTPRLVFADWLQENGDEERAEFIRLQIRLADRYTIAVNMMNGQDVEYDRAKALQEQFGARWLTDLPKREGWRWNFWRGFPTRVEVDYWQNLKSLFHLIRTTQPIEYLHQKILSRSSAQRFAAHPALSHIRYLRLNELGGLQTLETVLASPHLTGLKYLGLRHCDIGDAGARIVAASPNLASLKLLDLACNQIDDAGVRAICQSPYLRNIGYLDFERNVFSEDLEPEFRRVFGERVDF